MQALVPELAVRDWQRSRTFYVELLGFAVRYARPEEGFAFLALGDAEIMVDQIDLGRSFGGAFAPDAYPFGRGVNLQIRVPAVAPLVAKLTRAGIPLVLPVEDRWYRRGQEEVGQRQLLVADPDGYLLRPFETLGTRPA